MFEKNREKKAQKILTKIDRRFTVVGPIDKKSIKPVYQVENQETGEKAVLKCSESDSNLLKRAIKNLFGTSAARTERAFYKWISSQEFQQFQSPQFLGSYKSNLLISFEEGVEDPDARDVRVTSALHEFYKKSHGFRIFGVHKLFHQIRYSSLTSNLRTLLHLRSEIDKETCWQVLRLIKYCYKNQRPLINSFWIHNDFTANNVLHSLENDYPVIIDFQALKKEKRWLLNDIVRYSFRGDIEIINFTYIKKFTEEIDFSYYGSHLNVDVQIRYALLCRTLQSLLWKNKPHILDFLTTILIDDEVFSNWLKFGLEKVEMDPILVHSVS